jgi:hypothetical protein
VLDSDRDRIFNDWLAGHKGILFKVGHAYASEHADRQDLAVPVVAAVAALFMGAALYMTRRAQALREQRFGDSLRDQLARRIAQLDDAATRTLRTMSAALISIFVFATAMRLASLRMTLEPDEPFELVDDWPRLVRRILIFTAFWLIGRWAVRRAIQREILPRQRRLEALLKELDA